MEQRLLAIYLRDHFAGATLGRELVRRACRSNEGSELGRFLSRLVEEIEEDRATLERVMSAVGTRPSTVKVGLAWAAEKAGRLKLNGRLTSYSPLSRLVELEGLFMGIAGKEALWRALARLDDPNGRLAAFDFQALAERAARQREELERHRLEAAATAFARPG